MKRLCAALFVCIMTASAEAQVKATLNVEDCNVLMIFAHVWRNAPMVLTENAVWVLINSEGQYEFKRWLHTPLLGKQQWKGPIPKGTIAQVHTHPDALNARPSHQDQSLARQIEMPIYTLSREGIWKVSKDGTITQESQAAWFEAARQRCGSDVKISEAR